MFCELQNTVHILKNEILKNDFVFFFYFPSHKAFGGAILKYTIINLQLHFVKRQYSKVTITYVKIKIPFLEKRGCCFYILPVMEFGFSFLLHTEKMITNFAGKEQKNSRLQA